MLNVRYATKMFATFNNVYTTSSVSIIGREALVFRVEGRGDLRRGEVTTTKKMISQKERERKRKYNGRKKS